MEEMMERTKLALKIRNLTELYELVRKKIIRDEI